MTTAYMAPVLSADRMKEIDDFFFDEKKNWKLHPAEKVNEIPAEELGSWCNRRAIYGLPTIELIDFLKGEIGEMKAIEIGAGHGYLGESLGIIQTDSKLQQRPDVANHYANLGQPTIDYPERVKKFDAVEAVRRFSPDVVIGCWVTQKSLVMIPQSSRFGINEEALLGMVEKYIMIGHEDQHDQKKILKYSHRKIKADWICSRALDRSKNVIYIWQPNNSNEVKNV